jgi:DNA-binding NtrC family response regulator
MRLVESGQPGKLAPSARQGAWRTLPELDELRRLMGVEQVFVFGRGCSKGNRLLAGSLTGPVPAASLLDTDQNRLRSLERAGCLFALNLFTAFSEAHKGSAFQLETTEEIEHLMARILGRLIVGSEGSVVYQVAESDPRCLALASPGSLAILKEAEGIALSDRPVLLMGESGVGKELLARFIHRASGRQKFVAITMAQIRGDTAVSELFGHTKGAFTGATARRPGAFLEAGEGTLFLDEISEVRPDAAALLLRAIEERSVKPLGSDQEIAVRARILAATNRADDLRHDLFHRFFYRIVVPPLRERPEDIRAIAQFIGFRDGFAISEKALHALTFISPWKGNARELEYFLFHASRRAQGRMVGIQDVVATLGSSAGATLGGEADACWVRAVRENLGLSLRDFSRVVDIPKSTLEDMEKGRTDGRKPEIVHRLAKHLESQLEGASASREGKSRVKMKDELKRFLAEE